jgi:hypothetical protein
LEKVLQTAKEKFGLTPENVNQKFEELALRHHPDHGGNAEVFIELRALRDILRKKNSQLAKDYLDGKIQTSAPSKASVPRRGFSPKIEVVDLTENHAQPSYPPKKTGSSDEPLPPAWKIGQSVSPLAMVRANEALVRQSRASSPDQVPLSADSGAPTKTQTDKGPEADPFIQASDRKDEEEEEGHHTSGGKKQRIEGGITNRLGNIVRDLFKKNKSPAPSKITTVADNSSPIEVKDLKGNDSYLLMKPEKGANPPAGHFRFRIQDVRRSVEGITITGRTWDMSSPHSKGSHQGRVTERQYGPELTLTLSEKSSALLGLINEAGMAQTKPVSFWLKKETHAGKKDPNYVQSVRRREGMNDSATFEALRNGEVVGRLSVHYRADGGIYLLGMATAPAHRRKGVSEALFKEALKGRKSAEMHVDNDETRFALDETYRKVSAEGKSGEALQKALAQTFIATPIGKPLDRNGFKFFQFNRELREGRVSFDVIAARSSPRTETPNEWQTKVEEVAKKSGAKLSGEHSQNLAKALEKSIIKERQLEDVAGMGGVEWSLERISEMEVYLNLPRSKWLEELAKEPTDFLKHFREVKNTQGHLRRLVKLVSEGRDANEVRHVLTQALDHEGHKVPGMKTKELVDRLIRVVESAQSAGFLTNEGSADSQQGISRAQLSHLLTVLVVRNAPPLAIEGRLQQISGMSPAVRRAEFLKALIQRETPSLKSAEGKAEMVDFNIIKAEADRVAAADAVLTAPWAKETLQKIQSGVLMADNNFGRREKYLRILDHHGVYGQEKNSTMQMLDLFEKALYEAHGDVKKTIANLNLRQVSTDNLGDGGWCLWIARNQERVLRDPGLRRLIREATFFEDFSAFGDGFDPKAPAVRLQLALFDRYNQIVQKHGLQMMDRLSGLPTEKVEQAMNEVVAAIDEVLPKEGSEELPPTTLEAGDKTWMGILQEAAPLAKREATMKESVAGKILFMNLDVLKEKYPIFTRWLAVPRAHDLSLQVTVDTKGTENGVTRREMLIAIPHGRELPSKKGLTSIQPKLNALEQAKAKERGLKPANWLGKDSILFPAGASILTPEELSNFLVDPGQGLFVSDSTPPSHPGSSEGSRRSDPSHSAAPGGPEKKGGGVERHGGRPSKAGIPGLRPGEGKRGHLNRPSEPQNRIAGVGGSGKLGLVKYPVTSISEEMPFDASLLLSGKSPSKDHTAREWQGWEVFAAYDGRVFLLSPKKYRAHQYKIYFKCHDPIPFKKGQKVDIIWEGPTGSGEAQKKNFRDCQQDLKRLETTLGWERFHSFPSKEGTVLARALQVRSRLYLDRAGTQSPLPPTEIDLKLPPTIDLGEFLIDTNFMAQDFVEFALEYAQFKSVLPLTKTYEALKHERLEREGKQLIKTHRDLQKEEISRFLNIDLFQYPPFQLRDEWNLYALENMARLPDSQKAWNNYRKSLDHKIEALVQSLGFAVPAEDNDLIDDELGRRYRMMPRSEAYLLVTEEVQREELSNLVQERRSLPEEPRTAWRKALDERVVLLERALENYKNDPELNKHGDLDAVVEALDELLRQKENSTYQISIATRAKVATVIQWVRMAEVFRRSGNPADRPFDLLALLDAKTAADQNLKSMGNSMPSLDAGKE